MGIFIDIPKMVTYIVGMKVFNAKKLNAYRASYPEADGQLKAWKTHMESNSFKHFPDLKKMFPSVDYKKPDRIIFNIKGNHFRLITAVDFSRQIVIVKWFGRHPEYDKINPSEV